MPRQPLPGTDLVLSRFGFGTASLHRLPRSRDRRRLLDAAVSMGFTHFDTAPVYGFGLCERELGAVLAAEPSLTVATKLGLYPPGSGDQPQAEVMLRKLLGKLYPPLSRFRIDFAVARAEASLTASLGRLQRERADLLLIHEPEMDLIATEEWQRWVERERARGRLRAFGVAGEMARLKPFLDGGSLLSQVLQTADSLDGQEADSLLEAGRPLQITYGYLAAARRAGQPFDSRELLARALCRNPSGSILVSTGRIERLSDYAAAAADRGA